MGTCHVTEFAGPPTGAPNGLGNHWIDTLNKKNYLSVGTASVADWELVEADTDIKTAVSGADTTPGFLDDEIAVGSTKLSKTITSPGADEKLELDVVEANIDHDALTNSHNLTTNIDHNTITNNHNLTTDIDHDALTNYSAAEHVDWAGASAGTIHASNYVDNDTTDHTALSNIGVNAHSVIDTHLADSTVHFTEASIDHDSITNTHNLTTSIDHNTITNNHNLTTDIDHDQLTNFVANEHIDWSAPSAGTIHASNYVDNNITSHTGLTDIGTNTHAAIDTHISDTTIHYTQASISIPASQISDFDTEVSNNTDVAANTSARHTHANKAQLDLITDGDHDVRTDNPHAVTKTQVGLANVPNVDATARANHTGTQLASTISDFDTEVSNNTSVTANTAKVTNATHTGEVTGSTVLTLDSTAITNQTSVMPVGADEMLISDNSDSGNLKKVTVTDIVSLAVSSTVTGYSWKDISNSSNSYLVEARIIFPGSTAAGTPTTIDAAIDVASTDASIRIFDVTNSLTIAEATGITGALQIVDLGTLSNIPTGPAIWEIQMEKNGGGSNTLDGIIIF